MAKQDYKFIISIKDYDYPYINSILSNNFNH